MRARGRRPGDLPGGPPGPSLSTRLSRGGTLHAWRERCRSWDGSRSGSFVQVSIADGYDQFMLSQLFEPWAADLIARANLKPGCSVLDVASGLGSVARLAAQAAGPDGRVVASDISVAMLAVASARPEGPGWATIEYLQCPRVGDRC